MGRAGQFREAGSGEARVEFVYDDGTRCGGWIGSSGGGDMDFSCVHGDTEIGQVDRLGSLERQGEGCEKFAIHSCVLDAPKHWMEER